MSEGWTVNIVILEEADMAIRRLDGSVYTAHHPVGTIYLGDWGTGLPNVIPLNADILAKKSSDGGGTWEEFTWSFENQNHIFNYVSIILPPPPPPV